jgi:hypothetical protein
MAEYYAVLARAVHQSLTATTDIVSQIETAGRQVFPVTMAGCRRES